MRNRSFFGFCKQTLNREAVPAKTLEELKHEKLASLEYLEDVVDKELGRDRGSLAGKEVLVYAPTKTGTTSLYWMISDYLTPIRGWDDRARYMLHNHSNLSLVQHLGFPDYLKPKDVHERWLIRDLIKYKRIHNQRIQIVSSFRDPLSRVISDIFHYVEHALLDRGRAIEDISFEWCYEYFIKEINDHYDRHHPLEELEDDFFERRQFDHQAKFCYVRDQGCEILTVVLEHSDCWKAALETSFGFSGIKPIKKNTIDQKKVVEKSREFKERMELPLEIIDRIYFGDNRQQRQLRWFYTNDEINRFYQRAMSLYGPKKYKRTRGLGQN